MTRAEQARADAKYALAEAKAIVAEARSKGGRLTDSQRFRIESLEQKAQELMATANTRDRVDRMGGMGGGGLADDGGVESAGEALGKALKGMTRGSGSWSTGQIEVKALLDSGAAGDNFNGAGGLLNADVRPGILEILSERLTLADLMPQSTTTSPLVRYMVEKTADSGAAGVPESGEKPESTLEFDAADAPVKKIATFLPVTDEVLEDIPNMANYVNRRLALFVRQEEEAQLLDGAGGDDLDGILGQVPGGNQGLISDAPDRTMLDDIYAAITKVRASFLEPDAIVMHPDDFAKIQSLKDDLGRYLGSGPFGSEAERLWGKRVVVTSAIDQGTALVGDFRNGAEIFRRGGVTVEASNSHQDYFQHNKTAIRAEERLALAIYRPEAFATADVDLVS